MEYSMIGIIGENTLVAVRFDYTPYQPAKLFCEMTDSLPAFDAEVTINQVLKAGDNIMGDLSEDCLDRLKIGCFGFMEEK